MFPRKASASSQTKLRQAPAPFVPRLARSYQVIRRTEIDRLQYPAIGVTSIAPTLHDIPLVQGLFRCEANFAKESACEILEVRSDEFGQPVGSWKHLSDDDQVTTFIESLTKSVENDSLRLRAVFCTLKPLKGASFGLQLSLARTHCLDLLNALSVCPQFCTSMLGEPDYWSPLVIRTRSESGKIVREDFCSQHPRYTIHSRQQPCSVYFSYDLEKATTTYFVSSGEGEQWLEQAKSRISDYYIRQETDPSLAANESFDPFLFQSILCHESLLGAKLPITDLRHRLYDVLDVVGEYSKEPFDRANLKEMTYKLHGVSQDADSLYASAEMGLMVAEQSMKSRQDMLSRAGPQLAFVGSNVGDALKYLVQSLESQKRWLQSYKSRKDIAMNLVFNLVTQQDSEVGTSIARDTKDDSASMKIIAVLTMVFLPATAVSGFFGMSFFEITENGTLVSSPMLWLFAAATVPLTLFTFCLWVFWDPISQKLEQTIRAKDGPSGSDRNKV